MNSPLCQHLRTKKLFIPALADEAVREMTTGQPCGCHYWCNRTLTETGMDEAPVHPEACVPTRGCFEE